MQAKIKNVSRRSFLKTGAVVAGGVGLVAFQGPAFALGMEIAQQAQTDADLINFEYGLEYAAIEAYKAAAGTGLIPQDVLTVALRFVAQHTDHMNGWASELRKLGGTPIPLVIGKYPDLKTVGDIASFAKTLEEVAVGSYYGAVGKFTDPAFQNIAAAIMPIEAQHVSVFAALLNQDPFPSAFVTGTPEAQITQIATALQLGPVPGMPTRPPASGAGGLNQSDNTGLVIATLSAVGAAAAAMMAARKHRPQAQQDQE
jgi:Ferritin-like domain/TAT (twin-arginine translocation) pathway signal sequence